MPAQMTGTPRLRLLGDDASGGEFGLDRDVTLIGRDRGCDVVLNINTVSRRHARVVRRRGGHYLEDLGSTGGTLLNGEPLRAATRLKEGDLIALGDALLAFSATADGVAPGQGPAIIGLREVSDTTEHELAGVRSEEKLRALLEIGRDLTGSRDLKDVLARTLDALFRIFPKAERGFVLLKAEGAGALVPRAIKFRGGGAGRLTVSRTIFEHVILHGQGVLSEDATVDARFGGSRSVDEAEIRTLMCVPLRDHRGQPLGILQLDTRDRLSRFTPDDLDVLVAVAGQLSAAVDNARLFEEAEHERCRLAFLAEAGAALSSVLDLPATLAAVARLSVPELADLCAIDLRDEGGAVRRVAAAHADPSKQAIVDALRRHDPQGPTGPHPVLRVLEASRPEMANAVSDQDLASVAHDAEHLAILRRLGLSSYLVVPLMARGRTLGAVSLVGTGPGRRYGPADLVLAEDLARRAAQAIDNAALYEAAQEARRCAEEAGRSKDLFLAMLSHELRTPLTPILAVASAHLAGGGDPARLGEWEMVRRNVALEARLIDDLLDLSRIGRGRLLLDREVVDVHRTIRQAAETCRDETFVAGLEVVLDLAAPAHHVEADQARLMQVAWNLIRNAAKFTPGGGTLTIRTRNEEGGADPAAAPASAPAPGRGPLLVVEFEDTGQGIDPHILPRIFDAFEQGQADLRGRSGGLGLGLAICRSLVEAHGGRLTARSPGRGLGSTFRLELATVPAPDVPTPLAPPSPPRAGPLRVLLVEDNRDTRQFLALVLGRRGHDVRAAASLSAARAEAAAGAFDLLISDIELPDGTGLDLMRELAGLGLPGIAMSGFGSEDDVLQSREAGFAAHLTKPVDIGTLEAAIRRAVPQVVPTPDD